MRFRSSMELYPLYYLQTYIKEWNVRVRESRKELGLARVSLGCAR